MSRNSITARNSFLASSSATALSLIFIFLPVFITVSISPEATTLRTQRTLQMQRRIVGTSQRSFTVFPKDAWKSRIQQQKLWSIAARLRRNRKKIASMTNNALVAV
jgi:hypothetical protein